MRSNLIKLRRPTQQANLFSAITVLANDLAAVVAVNDLPTVLPVDKSVGVERTAAVLVVGSSSAD